MSDLTFISGQLSALQSKLLSQEQIDRMVGAKDAEGAFDIMSEFSYSEYLMKDTKVKDFYSVLNRGLLDTKNLIDKHLACDNRKTFLWARFDLNNIRRLLKRKLVEGKTEQSDIFHIKDGFSHLGNISDQKLLAIIFSVTLFTFVGCDEASLTEAVLGENSVTLSGDISKSYDAIAMAGLAQDDSISTFGIILTPKDSQTEMLTFAKQADELPAVGTYEVGKISIDTDLEEKFISVYSVDSGTSSYFMTSTINPLSLVIAKENYQNQP